MLLRPGPYAPLIAGPAGGVRIADQYAEGLISLYAPGMSGPGHFPDLRNLAPSGGHPTVASTTLRPAASLRPFGAGAYIPPGLGLARTSGRMWSPGSAGGVQPITILHYGTQIDRQALFSGVYGYWDGGSGPLFSLFIPDGTNVGLQARLSGTIRTLSGGILRGPNSAIVSIATLRSATDWSLVQASASEETATAMSIQTSATSLGSATLDATFEDIGGLAANTSLNWTEQDFFLGATWLRSMTTEEMVAIARDPMSILAPERALWTVQLPDTTVSGDLAATLGDAALASSVSVRIVGDAAVTLAAATLAAQAENPIVADLAEALGAAGLSSVVSVNNGVAGIVGETPLLLDNATLSATVENDVFGDLSVSLDAAALAAIATAGSTGPFAIRPSLVFT